MFRLPTTIPDMISAPLSRSGYFLTTGGTEMTLRGNDDHANLNTRRRRNLEKIIGKKT